MFRCWWPFCFFADGLCPGAWACRGGWCWPPLWIQCIFEGRECPAHHICWYTGNVKLIRRESRNTFQLEYMLLKLYVITFFFFICPSTVCCSYSTDQLSSFCLRWGELWCIGFCLLCLFHGKASKPWQGNIPSPCPYCISFLDRFASVFCRFWCPVSVLDPCSSSPRAMALSASGLPWRSTCACVHLQVFGGNFTKILSMLCGLYDDEFVSYLSIPTKRAITMKPAGW